VPRAGVVALKGTVTIVVVMTRASVEGLEVRGHMTTIDKSAKLIWPLAILVCTAWLGFVVWRASTGWPTLPLDVNASDPAVVDVYQSAVRQHALNVILIGFAPLLLVYAVAKLARR
jgi:hypothetical protein